MPCAFETFAKTAFVPEFDKTTDNAICLSATAKLPCSNPYRYCATWWFWWVQWKNRDSVPKLFYVKTMPARAMRVCSLIAESNMFYIKRIISSYLPRPVKWLPAIQTSQMTIPTSINIKSIVIIILMIRIVFYNYLCTQIYW